MIAVPPPMISADAWYILRKAKLAPPDTSFQFPPYPEATVRQLLQIHRGGDGFPVIPKVVL